MKKLLKPLFVATLAVPALAFADTAPQTTTVEKVQAAARILRPLGRRIPWAG